MDIFSQVDCMVEDGVLTEEQADQYRNIMKHLTGLQTEDLLMLIASSRPLSNTYVSGNTDVSSGASLSVDTSTAAVTITLPEAPLVGDRVDLYDAQGTWATHNVTVVGNGHNINGSASNLILNVNGSHATLIFNGGATGWKSYL